MLKQRVLTALALLAVLLPALAAQSPWPFMALVALAVTLAGWEWGRLNGLTFVPAVGLGVVVLGLIAAALTAAPPPALWALVWLVWGLGGAWILRRGVAGWAAWPAWVRLAFGPVLLVPAGLALVQWKGLGLNALLSVLCLVWMADIAAYFGGRTWGRRKLAPAISPGKSWEGVWTGWAGVLMLVVFWVVVVDAQPWVDGPSAFARWGAHWGWGLTGLICLALAAFSVLGDLVESLIKRAAGAKDSSQLLPGHGGVLDRIDALLPVLPAAWALLL